LGIAQIMADVNKKYGQGALVKGADARGLKMDRLRTGSISLDIATGGGWAAGKVNEIFGPYSSGKSYIMQTTIAQMQKDHPDANVALIDFEGSYTKDWAEKIGVNTSNLYIASPEYMEDGLQIATDLIHSNDCALLVIDSIAAANPKAEAEGDMADFSVGLRARLGNKFIRKSRGKTDICGETFDLGNTTILIINQTYKNIGGYGSPDTTPGGEQIKFAAMIRARIRRGETEDSKVDGAVIMQECKFTIEKNKTFPPHKAGAFWFSVQDNPKGHAGEIYRVGEIITHGMVSGVISRSGAWYSLPEEFGLEKALQGEKGVIEWVENNPELFPRLEELVLANAF
jgi:recombination protein RecA